MAELIFNTIGLIGVILLLIAFFLLQHGTLKEHALPYPLMNLFGALCIIVSLYHDWNLPQFILETIWAAISIYGIIKIIKAQNA